MNGLGDVYWIGGGSGAAKSTVARCLAQRFNLAVYSTDRTMAAHSKRCPPDRAPLIQQFLAMDTDERWVNRPPQAMFETFHWFNGEAFDLVVEDLVAKTSADAAVAAAATATAQASAPVDAEGGIVAEGFRLLPSLLAPILDDRSRALWLLPTPEFRRTAFAGRGTMWDIPDRTSDPERALANLLARDGLFTDWVAEQASALGLPTIAVDGSLSEAALADRVADQFGLV